MTSLPELPDHGIRVAIVGKGGSTKTTALAHFLKRWSDLGVPTAGLDTDEPGEDEDGSLATWDELSPIGCPVAAHRDAMSLPQMALACTPERGILGIDTDAWKARVGGAHMAALSVAHLAVLMIQPTGMELQRAASVRTAFATMQAMGMVPPPLLVCLTRTNASAASPGETAGNLREAGYDVLNVWIPNSDARRGYSQSFGKPLHVPASDPMAMAADKILEVAVRGS
ncbi:hypothetical protein AB0J38_14495 [Streptomyces sp. NPDC050095]|uniref:hypothetical protein n=1 Tax=unclassified Streptomyces TaxID=2593676 RepID=UPI003425FF7F